MHSFFIFIGSTLVSFIGSLQLGPVNLFVINTALNENKKLAIMACLGGIIPEFIYCGLAVYSSNYFLKFPTVFLILKILLVAIFLIIGAYYLFKKHTITQLAESQKSIIHSKFNYFLKGFTLASLNPQLLPFWMLVLVYFNSNSFLKLKSEPDNLAYILGSGIGAFMLLLFIALLINKFKTTILGYLNNKYYFKFLGILFLVIAIQQFFTII
jgi:threonine/homoserine/homoserine lactone efflux protein